MQLSQAEITQVNQQQYFVEGTVDFSTAPELIRQVSAYFKAHAQSDAAEVEMDLSKIIACNSAGLALMLEIVKAAKTRNIKVKFTHLPDT